MLVVKESLEKVTGTLKEWREGLEGKRLRKNRVKTKSIEYDFKEQLIATILELLKCAPMSSGINGSNFINNNISGIIVVFVI